MEREKQIFNTNSPTTTTTNNNPIFNCSFCDKTFVNVKSIN